MELPEGSPLMGLVQVGARLRAIDGETTDDLDVVRDVVRRLRVGDTCVLEFDRGRVSCVLEPLPLESIPGGRVALGAVTTLDGYRLRSVWTFPKGPPPFPLIWILPTANWLSEEHVQQRWHPTLKFVRALTTLGFATLRVERSGLGDSEGPPCVDTDLKTELDWCRSAHADLLAHPDVEEWFLFGRSLGGTLVQLLAHELQPRAAAVWGATSLPWHEAMMQSARRQRALSGVGEPELSRVLELRRRLSEAVLVRGESARAVLAREPELEEVAQDFLGGRIHGRVARFFQQVQAHDVAATWGRFAAPAWVGRGALDWLTSEDDAASVVAAARHPTFESFADIDHLMHRRQSMQEAFDHTFGGDFDAGGAEAITAFFRAQTTARLRGSGNTPP